MSVLYWAVVILGAWMVFQMLMMPFTRRNLINRRARSKGYQPHFTNVIVISNNIKSNNSK